MPLEPVSRLLGRSAELAAFRDRLAVVASLQAQYRRAAPEALAAASRVCALDGSTVVIGADNGSVAAAIKAIGPRLVTALNRARVGQGEAKTKRNQEVTALRVEVQVAASPARRAAPAIVPPAAETLDRLADGLSDSPLREVLRRMASAAQTRRTARSTR